MLTTAPMPITAAAMVKPVSSGLLRTRPAGARPRGAGAAAEAGRGALAAAGADPGGLAIRAPGGAAAVGGLGACGAVPGGLGAPGPAPAPAPPGGLAGAAAGGFPPPGKDGNLMVDVEVGLGGRLMRTVSFFGCTLGASAGFGGTPPDELESLSAICEI